MASLFTAGKFQAIGTNGLAAPGAKLHTYLAGGLVHQATYTTPAGTSANANPVVCNAAGQASVYLDSIAYRFILKDANDVTIWDVDNYTDHLTATIGVSVLDYIPSTHHAAILAYTSTVDVTDYINAAIGDSAVVHMPAGNYFITKPINMTARSNNAAAYWGRRLVGDGRGKTLIDGYTGNYPIVDFTGTSQSTLQGVWLRSDNPPASLSASDCASIGVMFSRGTTGSLTSGSNQCRLEDVKISLTSDMTRNSGVGTVGLVNHAAEHTSGDNVDITANLPIAMHNTLAFTVSRSNDAYGSEYEPGATGAGASTRIHDWTNCILISYDSFRLLSLKQVGEFNMPTIYGSTRKLVASVPSNAESVYVWDSQSVNIDMFQEVSGLFGAVYRQDHAYLRIGGNCTDLKIKIERAALDMGFTNPGVNSSSILLENDAYLNAFDIVCHNNIGDYNAGAFDAGLANEAIAMVSGTPNYVRNGRFTLDSVLSRTNGSVLTPLTGGVTNVESVNFLSGVSYNGHQFGAINPAIQGTSTGGVGTYTIQGGEYYRMGRMVHVSMHLGWSAHTGTGNLELAGLPFKALATTGDQILPLSHSGLTAASGKTVVLRVNQNATTGTFLMLDSSGGALSTIPIDTTVAAMDISGTYLIAD